VPLAIQRQIPRMEHDQGVGIRTAQAGLLVNAALAVIKVVSGVIGNSYALIADGIESTADLLSSTVVWSGLRIASRTADAEYPFGYGKAESLAAATVSLMLIGASIAITILAIREIVTPQHAPAPFTLVVLVAVVLVKEILYRRVQAVGRAVDSDALRADAWHHRSDAITSLAAFVGISIAIVGGEGWEPADDWAALVAALVILWNGQRLLRPAIAGLMDRSAPSPLLSRVHEIAAAVAHVRAVEKVIIRRAGTFYFADLHVEADPEMPLRDAHAISHAVKAAIMDQLPNVRGVLVHMEPHKAVEKLRS
jgi:cation diffusion facilitator family transporter